MLPNRWEEIGRWRSETEHKIEIKDIVWPENALKPPDGVPDRRFLSVNFMEEGNCYSENWTSTDKPGLTDNATI